MVIEETLCLHPAFSPSSTFCVLLEDLGWRDVVDFSSVSQLPLLGSSSREFPKKRFLTRVRATSSQSLLRREVSLREIGSQQSGMKRVLRSRSLPRWTFSRSISMAWYRETPNSSIIQEDKLLRDIFDDPHVWSAFNNSKTSPTGLFQIKDLSHPGGFKVLATRHLSRARQLVEEISAGKRNATLIRDVDRLSDTLCSVSDLAGFIRRTHPQVEWLAAANETFMEVVEYMNGLNQHQKLYELIATATPNSAEEKAVQSGLLHDFELSGMKLSEEARAKYLELSNAEIELEQEFSSTFKPAEEVVEFDKSELEGLNGATLFKVSTGRNTAAIPTTGDIPNLALQLCVNEETRRRIFEATRTAQQGHIDILEKFLSIRAELASLAGYKTYAELKLSDKMAKTPGIFPSHLV